MSLQHTALPNDPDIHMGEVFFIGLLGAEATQKLGVALGQALLKFFKLTSTHSCLIAAQGDLGAGKTTFAQGLAMGLGVQDRYINSPTYALIQSYLGEVPFHHADLYRLSDEDEVYFTGIEDLMDEGICFIEWPERAVSLFDRPHARLVLSVLGPEDQVEGYLSEDGTWNHDGSKAQTQIEGRKAQLTTYGLSTEAFQDLKQMMQHILMQQTLHSEE